MTRSKKLVECSVCDGCSEMQHLCLMLCGLLASCLCCWASSDPFSVIQSPSRILGHDGDQVQIICSWNISIAHKPKIKWIKDDQKLRLNQTDTKFTTFQNGSCAALVINGAKVTDAGFYTCEVTHDIPQLRKKNGTGTNLIYNGETDWVTPPGWNTSPQNAEQRSVSAWAWPSAAVLSLAVCVCLIVWQMKRKCTQSERTVIREEPPNEEAESEFSEGGENSRGSTQWNTVTVYESYFDLQRTDEKQCTDDTRASTPK